MAAHPMSVTARLDRLLAIPSATDPTNARVGRSVAAIASSGLLAVALGALLVMTTESHPGWGTVATLVAIVALCLTTLWLVRRGAYAAGGRLLFLAGTASTTALVLTGRTTGFTDVGMMLYPVLVIAASLFFRRSEALAALALTLALLCAMLAAILGGLIPSMDSPRQIMANFGFAVIIIAIAGLAARFMASGMATSDREHESHRALSRANQELQQEAAEQEALIRQLEARNAELQSFTYTVSHDLRSPLVTIGGFVGCLEKNADSAQPEELLADPDRIRQAQTRMGKLLADLLDLSRIGRLANPPEEVPFLALVEEARSRLADDLQTSGALLTTGPDLPLVTGDRPRLAQLVTSLLENFLRFAGSERPEVEIGSREVNKETVFHVRDQGIGIDPHHLERVFGLFRKLNPEAPGTGAGLTIARRIVEVHGGRI